MSVQGANVTSNCSGLARVFSKSRFAHLSRGKDIRPQTKQKLFNILHLLLLHPLCAPRQHTPEEEAYRLTRRGQEPDYPQYERTYQRMWWQARGSRFQDEVPVVVEEQESEERGVCCWAEEVLEVFPICRGGRRRTSVEADVSRGEERGRVLTILE